MPGPADDVLKELTEHSSPDWVVRGGWPAAPSTLIDADIGTISGAADKVIRVAGKTVWLLSMDFQSGHDTLAKVADLLLYNCALHRRHHLLVRSLLVLLHKGADSKKLTGYYQRGFAGEAPTATLQYNVLRVWEVPATTWLSGGLGLVPLAPMGKVTEAELPSVVAQMKLRFEREAPSRAKSLWSATYILMGLRYQPDFTDKLLRGVQNMEESTTYQAILQKGEAKGEARGEAKEARKMLVLMGSERFGDPSPEITAQLAAVTEVAQLEALAIRILHVATWEELLNENGTKRPRRGRK